MGRATGVEGQNTALRAARTDAYLQLAEQAFPIQLVQEYRSGRTGTDRDVDEQTESRLLGRLRSARALEEHWEHRREYLLSGYRDVFDAWALCGIPDQALAGLYPAELKRARSEVARVQALLDGLPVAGGGAERMDLALIVRSVQEARRRLAELQEVDGTQEMLARVIALSTELGRSVIVTAQPPDQAPPGATLLRVSHQGSPARGVDVHVKNVEGVESWTVPLSDEGVVQLPLVAASPLRGLELEVSLPGLRETTRRVDVPPRVHCVTPRASVRLSGVSAPALGTRLQTRVLGLVQGARLRWCPPETSEPGAGLAAEVDVHVGTVGNISRDVLGMSGQALVRVRVISPDGHEDTIAAAGPVPVRGAGLNMAQVQSGLETSVMKEVEQVISSALARL